MAYKEVLRSGNTRGDTPLAGGRQSATDRVRAGLSRVTVRKYLAAAMAAGLEQDGPASDEVQLSRLAASTRKAMSSRSVGRCDGRCHTGAVAVEQNFHHHPGMVGRAPVFHLRLGL